MIRILVSIFLGIFLLAGTQLASAQASVHKKRPHIMSKAQYDCLIKHRSKLRAVGGKGTLFDLSPCGRNRAPVAVRGAWPVDPSEKYVQLSQNDLICLGNRKKTTAVVRTDGKIAIYVEPCGTGS